MRPEDWLRDAEEALLVGQRLGKRVILVGSSTGGTLAVWLARRHPELAAVVLLSPNFGVYAPSHWQALQTQLVQGPWGEQLAQRCVGPYFTQFEPVNADHARYWTSRYRTTGFVSLLTLVSYCRALDLKTVTSPTLAVYSPHDKVVDGTAIVDAFDRLGTPQKKLVAFSAARGHVLAGDVLSPQTSSELVDTITEFLQECDASELQTDEPARR